MHSLTNGFKLRVVEKLDLIQIPDKNIESSRLDQNQKRKNWINLTWSKSRTQHIGSSRISEIDLFDSNPGSRYIFVDPAYKYKSGPYLRVSVIYYKI